MQNSRAGAGSPVPALCQGTVLPFARGMAKASYLARLPQVAQKRGDRSKGEIEIVTKKKKVRRIDAECGTELEGSALGTSGKRIGILLELCH